MKEHPSDFEAMLTPHVRQLARKVLECADTKGLSLTTAESCTGGLLSTLLTDLPGISHRFECGFVVYSDASKNQLLGIPSAMIDRHGAVSREIALEMAERALDRCDADVSLSITGFAGPGGENDEEGLVHFAVARKGLPVEHRESHFGRIGRDNVRAKALEVGLEMLERAVKAA